MLVSMLIAITIHPICPIEEYASSGRNCVWFIPPIPPTKALITAINATIKNELRGIIIIRINNGLSFCHVDKMRHINQFILAITLGSQ